MLARFKREFLFGCDSRSVCFVSSWSTWWWYHISSAGMTESAISKSTKSPTCGRAKTAAHTRQTTVTHGMPILHSPHGGVRHTQARPMRHTQARPMREGSDWAAVVPQRSSYCSTPAGAAPLFPGGHAAMTSCCVGAVCRVQQPTRQHAYCASRGGGAGQAHGCGHATNLCTNATGTAAV